MPANISLAEGLHTFSGLKNGEYLYVHGNGRNEELWDGDGWENYENINTGLFAWMLCAILRNNLQPLTNLLNLKNEIKKY